jgi:hypothetical protein
MIFILGKNETLSNEPFLAAQGPFRIRSIRFPPIQGKRRLLSRSMCAPLERLRYLDSTGVLMIWASSAATAERKLSGIAFA